MKVLNHEVMDLNALFRRTYDKHNIPTGYKCAVSIKFKDYRDKTSHDGIFRVAFRLTDSILKYQKATSKKIDGCEVVRDSYDTFYQCRNSPQLTMVMVALGQKVDPDMPINRKRPVLKQTALVIGQMPGEPLVGLLYVKDLKTRLVFDQSLAGEQRGSDAIAWARYVKDEEDIFA